ncbi:MAG: T9SS type A sorting domain-containing protein [FCB group bacterium]|nr:T9SS type A sorting domain-containing protein [FCB group bacterium]
MKKILITSILITSCLFSQLLINEIDYDQPGTDTSEFIELAGPAGTYNNVSLVLLNGNNGSAYRTFELGTIVLANESDGYGLYVIGGTTIPNVDFSTGFPASNGVQNGAPDGMELWVDGVIVDAVSYEGPMNDSQGNPMEMASDAGMLENGDNESLGRLGLDESPWQVSTPVTPGTINVDQVFSSDINMPPVADGGGNQFVEPGDLVTLDGSASYDTDGSIVYYIWEQLSGTSVVLTNAESPVATFTAPASAGALVFTLTVYDDLADSDTDEVTVTVGTLTIAEARALPTGSSAVVEGVVISPNFQSTNGEYAIQDATAGMVIFIVGVDPLLTLGDEVRVMGVVEEYNGKMEIVPAGIDDITVLGPADLPAVQTITVSDLANNGEDYESELIRIENVSVTSGDWPLEGSSANLTITDDGVSEVTMRIDSDTELDGSDEPVWPSHVTGVGGQYNSYQLMPRYVTDFVPTGGNQLPHADAGEDQMVEPGDLVTLDGSASYDPDGAGLAGYLWSQTEGPTVVLSDYEEPIVTFTAPAEDANLVFQLTVVDFDGDSDTDLITVVVSGGTLTLYDIQYTDVPGSGNDCYPSTMVGQTVSVTGIVTAVNGSGRFFLEDPSFDSWGGIYVYDSNVGPTRGDELTVTAPISEYYGLTELGSVSAFVVNSTGNAVAPVDITTGELSEACSMTAEAYEGMLVRLTNVTVTQAQDNHGQWYVDDGTGPCQIDDGMWVGGDLTPAVGDFYPEIIGAVDYSYSEYGINPRDEADLGGSSGPVEVSIHDLQFTTTAGSGEDCYPSEYAGQTVQVTGVVTAAETVNETTYNYFLQDPAASDWAGVYVFNSATGAAVGDNLTVIAEVSEYFGFTELGNVSGTTVNSQGNTTVALDITTAELAGGCSESGESLEGMLVRVNSVTVTTETDAYGQFYVDDGSGACQIDDGMFDGTYPVPLAGDEYTSITGVVDYSFSEYGINPRNIDDFATGSGCVADGDVTLDGATDILDIVAIVSHVLGNTVLDWSIICHADLDDSGTIDILDIVNIVDLILNGRIFQQPATGATLQVGGRSAVLNADGYVGGVQITLTHGVDFQLNLTEDAYYAAAHTEGGETTLIVLQPESALFTCNGDFAVESVVVATKEGYVDVNITTPVAFMTNYPNPFNPVTMISYTPGETGTVRLTIYDLLGKTVTRLVDDYQTAGTGYSVLWNGKDSRGVDVPSGIYFSRLENGGDVITSKLTLLR